MTTLLGAVVVAMGAALSLRGVLLITGRGRPVRGRRPRFVIAGPYRSMRNPIYAGAFVAMVGIAIACRSWFVAALAASLAVACHWWVVGREEPRLREQFGEAYAVYVRQVPRWLPGVRRTRRR